MAAKVFIILIFACVSAVFGFSTYQRQPALISKNEIIMLASWTRISTTKLRQIRGYHATKSLFLNRFLFDPYELDGRSSQSAVPTATLPATDYRTIHAAKVLGLMNGDKIRAGIILDQQLFIEPRKNYTTIFHEYNSNHTHHPSAGLVTDCAVITWIPEGKIKTPSPTKSGEPPGSLRIQLDHLHPSQLDSSSTPQVSLLLALPRPLQLARLLPMISQIGVDHLILCTANKVPKEYFGSHLFRKPHELRKGLIEGLCQSGDVRLPKVTLVSHHLKAFLENSLDDFFPPEKVARVVAHPSRGADLTSNSSNTTRLRSVHFPDPCRKLVVAIGPEGGWVEPTELEMFQRLNFQQVTLGRRILRTDVAVVSILALAQDICSSS